MPIYRQTVDLSTRQGIAAGATARYPDWPKVIDLVYGTSPSGALITRVSTSVSGEELLVVIEADKPGGTFEDMSAWIDALVAGGARQPWSPGFSSVAGLASYEITLSLPLQNFLVPSGAAPPEDDPQGPAPVQPTENPSSSAVPAPSSSPTPSSSAPTPPTPTPSPPVEATTSPSAPSSPSASPSGATP